MYDLTGRRIPTHVSDPTVAYHLRMMDTALQHQSAALNKLVATNERIASALERIALQYAGPAPATDQEEVKVEA